MNIMRSLLTLVAVAAVVGGGTMALFSDDATSSNNTFSSGTLDLKLSNNGTSFSQNVSKTFGADNLAPGDDIPLDKLTIKNDGTIDGSYIDMKFTLRSGDENKDLAEHIVLEDPTTNENGIRFGGDDGDSTNGSESDDLFTSTGGDYDVFHLDGSTELTYTLSDLSGGDGVVSLLDLHNFGTFRIYAGTPSGQDYGLKAGSIAMLWLDMLVEEALTEQGETVKMDIEFTIHQ